MFLRVALCLLLAAPGAAWAQFGSVAPQSPVGTTAGTIAAGNDSRIIASAANAAIAPVWRPMGLRSQYAYLGLSDGRRACATYRKYYNVENRAPSVGIKLRYSNAWGNQANGVENDAPNDETITASVETNTEFTTGTVFISDTHKILNKVTFNSNSSGFLAKGGGYIESDPLMIPLIPGQMLYVNTYVCADGNGEYPFNGAVRNPNDEQTNSGFTSSSVSVTASTTVTGTISLTATLGVVQTPVVPNTVWITGPGITGTATDNGSGVITGTGVTGTVNYTTGVWTLTFGTAQTGSYAVSAYVGPTTAVDDTMVLVPEDTQGLFQDSFGPSEILTLQAPSAGKRPFGALLVGDSIMAGGGNSNDDLSFADYCRMTAAGSNVPNYGAAKIAQWSETTASFVTPGDHNRRLALVKGEFDEVIDNYGSNDAAGGATLATLQANKLSEWALLGPYLPAGSKSIYVSTLLPRTTTTSGLIPVAGMGAGPSVRNEYNAWLYTEATAGVIGGVIDVNAGVELVPGSQTGTGDGEWASSTYTSDGTHPTMTGDLAACAIVGSYGSSPSPAFVAPF